MKILFDTDVTSEEIMQDLIEEIRNEEYEDYFDFLEKNERYYSFTFEEDDKIQDEFIILEKRLEKERKEEAKELMLAYLGQKDIEADYWRDIRSGL